MPGLPVQMFSQLSGERSDRGKPQVFRGSARSFREERENTSFRDSARSFREERENTSFRGSAHKI